MNRIQILMLHVLFGAACGSGNPATPSTTPQQRSPQSSGSVSGTTSGSATPPTLPENVVQAGDPVAAAGSGSAAQAPSVSGFGAANATVTNVSLAEAGLEPSSLDRTADPCSDFYQYTCGGWLKANPIPADRSQFGRFDEVQARNEKALIALLSAAQTATAPDEKPIGDYYAACMDTATIEANSKKSLAALIAKTSKVKDAKTWFAALLELHKAGNWVVWGAEAQADLKDSRNNVLYLDSAGLGLPDRDYYFEAQFKDKLVGYQQHLQRLFGLLGYDVTKATKAANDVIAIETALAAVTKTRVDRRDLAKLYNPVDAKGLAKVVKSVDWKAYWKALGVNPGKQLIVTTPAFFAAIDGLRKSQTAAAWASYFTYHSVTAHAIALPKALDDEVFALGKLLTGVEEQRSREKRCVASTTAALDHSVGRTFVAKHFPGQSKADADKLVDALVAAMRSQLQSIDWMTPETKAIATDKLGKIQRMVGYPDVWRAAPFAVNRKDFLGNRQRAAVAETKRLLVRAGKPVDRKEWLMGSYEVNAYYNPSANNTALPAGILQPPFFGGNRSVAANLGGIGMVIGHELTHGFDDQGSQFDASGNLVNWWREGDLAKFAEKGTCLAKQYSTFEVLPNAFVNGKLTLGENIADLGGVKMAYQALLAMRGNATSVTVADGLTEPQQFFVAVGQAWCQNIRKTESERLLKVDVHAPAKYRVYGALRNLPQFAEAFNCAQGTPMKPANTCTIW